MKHNLIVDVGFNNFINFDKVSAIALYKSNPIRRLAISAKEKDMYIDLSEGKKTRSIIIQDNGFVVGSYHLPKTLREAANRQRIKDKQMMQFKEE